MSPNFIVVGAAKAGTTWLYQCLREHPEVFVSTPKELHFFSREKNYSKGVDWYLSHFKEANQPAVGEVCPSYMYLPKVPPRMHSWNPEVKIIFILRNPIQRAYSAYCMQLDHGETTQDIKQELSTSSLFAQRGLYYQQIQEYLNIFSKEQVKILIYDDLKKDPETFLKQVYDFLDIDQSYQPETLRKRENARKPPPRNMAIYQPMRSLYLNLIEKNPNLEVFVHHIRRKGYLNLFYQLMRGGSYPKLSEEVARKLAVFYDDDIKALSKMMNRDLSYWLEPYLGHA
jgi:hypothetical protein